MKRKAVLSLLSICIAFSLVITGCTASSDSTAMVQTTESDTSENTVSLASNSENSLITAVSAIDTDQQFTDNDLDTGYDEENATKISFDTAGVAVSGSGAKAEDETVTITEEGTYLISGTVKNGQLIINAANSAKVHLVLSGLTMTNNDGPCILVTGADKVFVTLADGTENTLSDAGTEYVQTDSDVNADGVIYSKSDLTFNGSGTLTINAGYKHGIVCNDDLVFTGGTYNVTAVGKGIKANDSIRIKNGTFTINAQDDSIHTSNEDDSGKGYIYICGGTFNLSAGDDGVHAATALLITGGTLTVSKSYEGLEGDSIDITNGEICVNSSDDGLNASSADHSSDSETQAENQDSPQMQDPSSEADANAYIRISGGVLYVNAEGDGLDSNGMLYIEGGTITVDGPTQANNGALDYGTGAEITGGTVMAAGSSGMATTFGDSSTQYSVLYNFDSTLEAGTEITLTDADGTEVMSYTPSKAFSSIVFSSDELAAGDYTVTAGDTTEKITLSGVSTTAGTASGMGQQMGGPGKMGGPGRPGDTGDNNSTSSENDNTDTEQSN